MTDPRAARGIPQRLSDPQATASVHWTDPRTALAEALAECPPYEQSSPEDVWDGLAERGVRLVTEAGLRATLEKQGHVYAAVDAPAIFAALSGEATDAE